MSKATEVQNFDVRTSTGCCLAGVIVSGWWGWGWVTRVKGMMMADFKGGTKADTTKSESSTFVFREILLSELVQSAFLFVCFCL